VSTQQVVLADGDAVARRVAEDLAALCPAGSKRPFYLAVSGGSTPKKLFAVLAASYADKLAWDQLHLFWVDERWVSQDSPDSNYGAAKELWLSKVPIPAAQIFAMPVTGEPQAAALAYERSLQSTFRCDSDDVPSFHLILLGMGTDGHTASLFPGHPALQEHDRLIVDVEEPKVNPPRRLSMTMPVLVNARRIWFLVTGADKQGRLQQVMGQTRGAQERYPAARVFAGSRQTTWYLDEAAAVKKQPASSPPSA
jgi:6-phosphogluconolactonase